jgi:pimeloyl-ACP methyl ester carboxylesterase
VSEPLFEHRLELGGFETRALELEGAGPPVVLLHGFADSADTWRLVLAELGRRRQRAIALDLPGFATAAPLRTGESVLAQLDAFTDDAVRHAASEAGEPAVVAGNSLGGALALRAGERELPLRALMPIAPAGLDMPAWFGLIERDPLVRFVLRSPVPLPQPLLRGVVGEAYRQLAFARPRAAAREVVGAFTNHHRDRRAVARYLDTGRRLLPELDFPFDLAAIRAPVLLVWGENDRMVPSKGSRLVLDALGGRDRFTYELIERCGHCPQIEEPDRFVRVLLEFAAAPEAKVA